MASRFFQLLFRGARRTAVFVESFGFARGGALLLRELASPDAALVTVPMPGSRRPVTPENAVVYRSRYWPAEQPGRVIHRTAAPAGLAEEPARR
jgi:hypothetical protein